MSITQALHRAAQQSPGDLYSVYGDRTTTVAETYERVARIAGGLRRLGVRPDDHVALLGLNTDTYLQVLLAVPWAGAVLVPVNSRWSPKEIAYSLEEAAVRILLVDDAFAPVVPALRQACRGLEKVVHVGDAETPDGLVPLRDLLESDAVQDVGLHGDCVAGIFYTGGTTGFPKGVMLSHRNLAASAFGFAAAGLLPPKGRALHVAPLFHLAALSSWFSASLNGSTHVVLPGFDPEGVMRAVQEHRVASALLVPTMIQLLVDHPAIDSYDLSSLEVLTYGASPISESLIERTRRAFPSARLQQAYGMTELAPVATILRDEDHDDPVLRRSAGRAAPHALVRIVDPLDTEVPRGTVGEIVVSGDHVMLGYLDQPEATAEALRGGWMHTGDGGYMDDDGYIFVVDRIKDMIISGGENVYSTEVENVVALHPAVAQAAVIGVPDDQWGERVHAVVVLKPGHSLQLEELRSHCQQHIAGYKSPRSMDIVDAFPMSAAGKILKRDLRKARA